MEHVRGTPPEYKRLDTGRTDWKKATNELLNSMNARHNGEIRFRKKNETKYWHVLFYAISVCLKALTFGFGKWHYDNYAMTLGRTVWYPPQWDVSWSFGLTRHEGSHFDYAYFNMPDMQAHWIVGNEVPEIKAGGWKRFWYGVKYLWGAPLPVLWAIFRADVEYWGYLQNIRQSVWEHGGQCKESTRKWVLEQFTGPNYLWMTTKGAGEELVAKMVNQAEDEWKQGVLHMTMFGPGYGLIAFSEACACYDPDNCDLTHCPCKKARLTS